MWVRVPAAGLRPGMQCRRLDTGALIYTIRSVESAEVRGVGYVRAWCEHAPTDAVGTSDLLPHYWAPADEVTMFQPTQHDKE